MTAGRPFGSLLLGLALAALALRLAACSAIDPNPPNPHNVPDPESIHAADGGADATEEAP